MDLIQYGESSRSPSPEGLESKEEPSQGVIVNGHTDEQPPAADGDIVMTSGEVQGEANPGGVRTSDLVLPTWDIPPQKSLHASLDLISLLHLDTLYNTYVRPFADPIAHDEDFKADLGGGDHLGYRTGGVKQGKGVGVSGGKKKGGKKKKLEKGYEHLLDDCIDPTPLGINPKRETQSLIPLIPEYSTHPVEPSRYWTESIEVLDRSKFMVARLEVGSKVDGYSMGKKHGVDVAEEKRKKKRAQRLSQAPEETNQTSPQPPFSPTYQSQPPIPIKPPTYPLQRSSFSSATTASGQQGPSTPRPSYRGSSFPTPNNRASPFPFQNTPRRGFPNGPGGLGGHTPGTPGMRGTPRGGGRGYSRGTPRQSAPPSSGPGYGTGIAGGYQPSSTLDGGIRTPGQGNVKRPFDGGYQGSGTPKRTKGSRSQSPLGGSGPGEEGGIKRVFKPHG